MNKGWVAAGVLVAACSGKGLTDGDCGAGTRLKGGGCVAILTCGPGTTAVQDVCQLDGLVPQSCGEGTKLVEHTCVPVNGSEPFTCGAGTVADGNQCVPAADQAEGGAGGVASVNQAGQTGDLACGPGTYAQSGLCLPESTDLGVAGAGGETSVSCGPGTHLVNAQCLPDGEHFELLVPDPRIQADGLSKVPVLALGTDATGNPIKDSVIIVPSRVDAGQLNPSTISLTDFGGQTSFVPCNAVATPSCAGAFELRLVRVSNPSVVLAKAAATLVQPDGIGSTEQCKIGGNVLYLNGSPGDFIHPGEALITAGSFGASLSNGGMNFHFSLTPSNTNQYGLWWDVYFDSSKLGVALGPGVYDNAERWPFQGAGVPGLDVSGDGRGCNMLAGAFQIETLNVSAGALQEITASFRQFCDGGAALNGCLHYKAP